MKEIEEKKKKDTKRIRNWKEGPKENVMRETDKKKEHSGRKWESLEEKNFNDKKMQGN